MEGTHTSNNFHITENNGSKLQKIQICNSSYKSLTNMYKIQLVKDTFLTVQFVELIKKTPKQNKQNTFVPLKAAVTHLVPEVQI